MNRRELITLAAGAMAWPIRTHALKADRVQRPAGPRGPSRGGLHSLRSAGSRHPLRDPFHDAYVPISTVAERLESDPIRLRVVCSESFLETIEFNHDHALIDSRLVGFRGVRSHDEASACLLNGRHRELRIRCECILAFDRAIRYDPICFGHRFLQVVAG